jgi:type II secretory pathway pseudopilin PulG
VPRSTNRSGFGLIEILIIVLLVGILAAILIPKRKMDIREHNKEVSRDQMMLLDSAMQVYFQGNGIYTDDHDALFSIIGHELLVPDDSTDYPIVAKDSSYYLIFDPHGHGVVDNGDASWLRR